MAFKVWFITGCSSGFGHAITLEALSRGDKVIATARNPAKLAALKSAGADTMALDVTASLAELQKAASEAVKLYGHVDILLNNAGYVQDGILEEVTPEQDKAQFETNVFGLLNVTRAFVPYMRKARSGVIGNVSSVGAWRGFPGGTLYAASKWAVTGISESLTGELQDFGIKVCAIEPGYFRSNLLNDGNRSSGSSGRISDYEGGTSRKYLDLLDAVNNKQPGDILKGSKVIVDVLTEKTEKPVPLRLALGKDSNAMIKEKCESTIKEMKDWEQWTCTTDHDDVK